MSKPNGITFEDKENGFPVADRKRQSTAEDWNEVKAVVNELANRAHTELAELEDLPDGTSHTFFFDDAYTSPDRYSVVQLQVLEVRVENGENVYYDVGWKNLTKEVDRLTFETFRSQNLKLNCFIIYKPV